MRAPFSRTGQGGYSSLELAFSVAIFVVVLLSSLAMVDRDTHLARSALGIGTVENMAQDMLFEMERELVNATANDTRAFLSSDLGASATTMRVSSTRGFPPGGTAVVDRDNGAREVVRYAGFTADSFTGLERGLECTSNVAHADNSSVYWTGWALVPDTQPPPGNATGQAREPGGAVWFQGDGTGFCYRVPVDPANPFDGTDYLDSQGDIVWGAALDGQPATECDVALYFQPRTVLDESTTGDDINRDGDVEDVFDVGQIRRLTWNHTDSAAAPLDLGLGPSSVVQERCNYGSDLDADGFGDPIFLWNDDTRQLHIRIFVIGQSVADMPVVRTVESIIYLRNKPEVEN